MKIIKVIIISLLLMGINDLALAYDIKEIEPNEFKATVGNDEKIKFLFIFTSWCSVCKKSLPQVIDLQSSFNHKDVKIMLVSLDDNNDQIRSTFKGYEEGDFTVYRITQDNPREVLNALLKAGIFYQGSVPHSTIIDAHDQVVVNGNYQISSLKKGLEYLVKNK